MGCTAQHFHRHAPAHRVTGKRKALGRVAQQGGGHLLQTVSVPMVDDPANGVLLQCREHRLPDREIAHQAGDQQQLLGDTARKMA